MTVHFLQFATAAMRIFSTAIFSKYFKRDLFPLKKCKKIKNRNISFKRVYIIHLHFCFFWLMFYPLHGNIPPYWRCPELLGAGNRQCSVEPHDNPQAARRPFPKAAFYLICITFAKTKQYVRQSHFVRGETTLELTFWTAAEEAETAASTTPHMEGLPNPST